MGWVAGRAPGHKKTLPMGPLLQKCGQALRDRHLVLREPQFVAGGRFQEKGRLLSWTPTEEGSAGHSAAGSTGTGAAGTERKTVTTGTTHQRGG